MKYIRTKDGRILSFAPIKKYENDKATFEWFVANYCGGGINILKQADTIEELCDGIVAIRKSDNFKLLYTDSYINEAIKHYKKKTKEFKIYGAIWTNTGLIYVAKINKKGELELL